MATPLPAFVFGGGDSFDDIRECLPPRLLAVAAKGPAILGLPPPVVAAVSLAHLAASLGRCCLLDAGLVPIPACFNLAVVSDATPAFDWMSVLGRGWADAATKLQTLDPQSVQHVIRDAVQNAAAKGPDRSKINPQMEAYAEQIPLSIVNMLRRRSIVSNVSPKAVLRGVVDSRDHCVALLNGATDPLHEWALLPPGLQKELAEILMLSWQGKPLTVTAKGAEVPGTVHALWLTRTQAVKKALFEPGARNNQSAPVLLFRHHGNPKRLPDYSIPELAEWSKCLHIAFHYRKSHVQNDGAALTLDAPARQVAEEAYGQFIEAIKIAPSCRHPYLCWLPELHLRLYAILVIAQSIERLLQPAPIEQPQPDPAAQRYAMTNAVRLARWLAQEHYRVVGSFAKEEAIDKDAEATDSTDMEGLRDAILQRLRDCGPLKRRDLQRSFHELSASVRDLAVSQLKSLGKIEEGPMGELKLAA